jgi:hypothetical protein
MTSASMEPKILRVKVEQDDVGLFFATSPDLQGLLVAEPTLEALDKAIPAAVKALYAACGLDVVVSKAEDDDQGDSSPWIAFRAEAARSELEGKSAS